jgi:hypothetical protein
MRLPRRTVLATALIALAAVPAVAAAHGDPVVTPSNGDLLGETWVRGYQFPPAGPADPCVHLTRRVVRAYGVARCTLERGEALLLGAGTACSDLDEPPTYAVGARAQRRCAIATDRALIRSSTLSIDGAPAIDLRRPRFELVSPQQTFLLPPDNGFGAGPGPWTLTAHGWEAIVWRLGLGTHHVVNTVDFDGEVVAFDHVVDVVRHRR